MRPAVGFFAGYVPTPTVTYKTEGFAELEQALYLLAELHKYDSVTRQVMVKAAEKAMFPVLADATQAAPFDEDSAGPIHMKYTIRLDGRIPNNSDRKSQYVNPGDSAIAVVSVKKSAVSLAQEFGTSKIPARPFLRPALQTNADRVIENLRQELGALIDVYMQKLPRMKK